MVYVDGEGSNLDKFGSGEFVWLKDSGVNVEVLGNAIRNYSPPDRGVDTNYT